jgi:hypothetical protein
MGWEDQLWTELTEKSELDRIVMAGDVITRMMRDILPALADMRRSTIVDLIETGGYNATRLAESIGARPGTVARLIEEGRKKRRQLQDAA